MRLVAGEGTSYRAKFSALLVRQMVHPMDVQSILDFYNNRRTFGRPPLTRAGLDNLSPTEVEELILAWRRKEGF